MNKVKVFISQSMAGWEKARGCLIEQEVAKQDGLKIIYEGDHE